MTGGRPAARAAWLAALLALSVPGAPVAAQGIGSDEVARLAEANRLEAAGELVEAERVLAGIADARPASAPALLALERVLRNQGRLDELTDRVARGLEAEPESALLNQLALRTYAALDRRSELSAAAAAWIEAVPDVEVAYREVGRTWEELGDYDRARRVLEEGRTRLGADALGLELGRLYATLGDRELAAREWARAIGDEGRGIGQVRRALRASPDGGAGIIPLLVERLAGDRASEARLSAAVEFALSAGLEEVALPAAGQLAARLDGEDRRAFLLGTARRADGARLVRLAHWAFGELVEDGEDHVLPAVLGRHAELARELGGRGGAEAAPAAGAGNGTAEPRLAAALRVERLAAQDPAAAREALAAFREAHPSAPELDRLAAEVGQALLDEGEPAVDDVLAGVRGPRSALVRGRIALLAGDREAARSAFLAAASGLSGAEATQVLSLVTLLGRLSDPGTGVLARAMAAAATGEPGAGLDRVVEEAASLPAAERAALLAYAAALAENHELAADAQRLRRLVVMEHPRSDDAPAALLALARSLDAGDAGEAGEARELLERLVVEYPRSALVPQARRELDRLRRATEGRMLNQDPDR